MTAGAGTDEAHEIRRPMSERGGACTCWSIFVSCVGIVSACMSLRSRRLVNVYIEDAIVVSLLLSSYGHAIHESLQPAQLSMEPQACVRCLPRRDP